MHATSMGNDQQSQDADQGKDEAASPARALVADDNPVNLKIAVRMLEKLGYQVDAAADGLEAVSMHERREYTLILMDLRMPLLDGRGAAARVRCNEAAGRRVPIIAVTAASSDDVATRDPGPDIDAVVSKPLQLDALRNVLECWMPRSRVTLPRDTSLQEQAQAVRELRGDCLDELIPLFLTDSRRRIAALRDAALSNDIEAIQRIAHAFAGSSLAMGARPLSELCTALDRQCRSLGRVNGLSEVDEVDEVNRASAISWPEVSALIDVIDAESARFETVLAASLDQGVAPLR